VTAKVKLRSFPAMYLSSLLCPFPLRQDESLSGRSEAMEFMPSKNDDAAAYFQLTELTSADGSAGGQAKHEARYGKQ